MIATTPYQRPPFIYGEILSRTLHESEADKGPARPGIGTFLTQGAATGAVLWFLVIAFRTARIDSYYGLLFLGALPRFVAVGLATGAVKGLIIWLFTKLTRYRLIWFFRSLIAIAVLQAIEWGYYYYSGLASVPADPLAWWIVSRGFIGLSYGLVIGSRLKPWRAFTSGGEAIGKMSARILAGFVGLILRLAIVFVFMETVVIFIYIAHSNYSHREMVWAILTLSHFTAALLVVFLKMRFWLLAVLAAVVTAPGVMFVVEFRDGLGMLLYFCLAYLIAWAVFVLTRWPLTYAALAVINKELRYYLID